MYVYELIEKLKKYPQDMYLEFQGAYVFGYIKDEVINICYNHDDKGWISPEEINEKIK